MRPTLPAPGCATEAVLPINCFSEETLERHFDIEIDQLKDQLLLMAGRAESIVQKSIQALARRDQPLAEEVFEDDHVIDRQEIELEERCLELLARHQPLARDLRFITATLKISNDLERIGDHAVNIAGSTLKLLQEPPLKPLVDIPRMAELATGMLREALDAFVRRDAGGARHLVRRDDEVDQLNDQVFRELISFMIENPRTITRAMELILVARNLERVADLATNVAEEVVFITEARIIKHHAEDSEFGRS
jgi:phosphate transport system protein